MVGIDILNQFLFVYFRELISYIYNKVNQECQKNRNARDCSCTDKPLINMPSFNEVLLVLNSCKEWLKTVKIQIQRSGPQVK